MVLRAIRVIRDTAAIPPQPAANASLVAKTRRCRSSRYGPSISNRCRIAASSITNLHTAQTTAVQTPDVLKIPIQLLFYGPLVSLGRALTAQPFQQHRPARKIAPKPLSSRAAYRVNRRAG